VPYDVIFDGSRYWHLKGEIWEDLNTDSTKLRLEKQHELDKTRVYVGNNDLESALEFINHHNRVAAVYAIGGYTPGLYCIAPGQMMLVPTGFTMIEPNRTGGCFGPLRLLRQILPKDKDGRDQLRYAIAMWKVRRQSLNDRSFAPGQVQVFVGPKNCGKTWIQEQIITPLLGGREGEPFAYLSGDTRFNDDLLGAEHLKMSDEIATPEADKRRNMGTKLKGFIFNTSKRVEAKGATPTRIKHSFCHVTISSNDETEDLKVIPLLNDSTMDKISLFQCAKPEKGFPPFEKRKAFAAESAKHLPALAAFIDRFEIPRSMRTSEEAQRCGVDTYRNPKVQEMLVGISSEHKFFEAMSLIFTEAPSSPDSGEPIIMPAPVMGGATKIYAYMLARNQALTKSVCSSVGACGTFLSRLVKSNDYPVTESFQHNHKKVYTISLR
jgi:hypothetical protein